MLVLVGASATGKTVIAKRLQQKYNLEKYVTCTTRPKRVNEVDGIDYYFLSKDEFLDKISREEFVEMAKYNNNYYGSLKSECKPNKVVILEPNGVNSFYKTDLDFISILITAKKETRLNRMINRLDNPNDIKLRIENDDKIFDISNFSHIDYVIENDENNIEEIVDRIYKIYKQKY